MSECVCVRACVCVWFLVCIAYVHAYVRHGQVACTMSVGLDNVIM